MTRYICCLLFIFGCQTRVSQRPAPRESLVAIAPVIYEPDANDTIFVTAGYLDTLRKEQPAFGLSVYPPPDSSTFASSRFSSEAGQDEFYRFYAYFLRQQNGIAPLQEARIRLIQIMRAVNSLEAFKALGGTYFGHMYWRIEAYAEYELQQPWKNTPFHLSQKKAFISSLKKISWEEPPSDFQLNGVSTAIHTLDSLITDSFSLEQAQKFHDKFYR